jgi:hypothetical protein
VADGTTVEYDTVRSLAALLSGRGRDLHGIAADLRGSPGLADPDLAAGLGFARQVLGRVVDLLGDDLALTGQRVDGAVLVYERSDRTVGAAIGGSVPGGHAGPGQERPA